MVLAKSHLDSDSEEEQPMEVEESHAVKVLPQHRWLLEQLPALSQFSSAKKEACAILRQVRLIISPSTKLVPPAVDRGGHACHQCLPATHPPLPCMPPPPSLPPTIWSTMSGRYASYWNTSLFVRIDLHASVFIIFLDFIVLLFF